MQTKITLVSDDVRVYQTSFWNKIVQVLFLKVCLQAWTFTYLQPISKNS